MDQRYEISMLLDFYGQLLTKKQYEMIELHYNQDYSLAEISESFSISRQGVHDCIRKGKALLVRYEEKLSLVQRFFKQKLVAKDILESLQEIETINMLDKQRDTIQNIKEKLLTILDE